MNYVTYDQVINDLIDIYHYSKRCLQNIKYFVFIIEQLNEGLVDGIE